MSLDAKPALPIVKTRLDPPKGGPKVEATPDRIRSSNPAGGEIARSDYAKK
jgi:hypothetical protein